MAFIRSFLAMFAIAIALMTVVNAQDEPENAAESSRGLCSNPPAVSFQGEYCVVCSAQPWPEAEATTAATATTEEAADQDKATTAPGDPTEEPVDLRRKRRDTEAAANDTSSELQLIDMRPVNWDGDVAKLQLFTIGTKLYYKAKDGYELQGSAEINCLENGEWSEPPTCTKFCKTAPTVDNGKCGGDNFTPVPVNQRVDCTCNDGFNMEGANKITCTAEGNFTQAPTCTRIRLLTAIIEGCDIPTIRDGVCKDDNKENVSGKELGAGEEFSCSCHHGFELVAPAEPCQPTCKGDGEYTCLPTCNRLPPTTTVAPQCPYPPAIIHSGCVECANLTVNVTIQYGDFFTYRCDPGYELVGNPKVTCQRNGQWSRSPTCRLLPKTTRPPNCGRLPTIPNGYCLAEHDDDGVDVHFAGKEATCACSAGFELIGSDTLFCSFRGSNVLSWSRAPTCRLLTTTARPVCSLRSLQSLVANAFCQGSNAKGAPISVFSVGQQASCECLESFHEVEPKQVPTCEGSDKWANIPKCQPIPTTMAPQRCTPPIFDNGFCSHEDEASYNHALGESIKCQCNKGYKLEFDTMASIICRNSANTKVEEGAWSILPVCVIEQPVMRLAAAAAACPPVPAATTGGNCSKTGTRPLAEGGDVGDELICTCQTGFTLSNGGIAYCRSRGRGWSTTPPCVPTTTVAASTTKAPATTTKGPCKTCRLP